MNLKNILHKLACQERPKSHPTLSLHQSFLTSHIYICLMLLPSGPDMIHNKILHKSGNREKLYKIVRNFIMGNGFAAFLIDSNRNFFNFAVFFGIFFNFRGYDYPNRCRRKGANGTADKRSLPAFRAYQQRGKDIGEKRSAGHCCCKSGAGFLPSRSMYPVGNDTADRRPEKRLGKSVCAPENGHKRHRRPMPMDSSPACPRGTILPSGRTAAVCRRVRSSCFASPG